MRESGKSIKEIVKQTKEISNQLEESEQELHKEIRAINRLARMEDRPLNKNEKQVLRELTVAKEEIHNAYNELAYVTLRMLDDSKETQSIQGWISEVNRDLEDNLARLQRIASNAEEFQKFVNTVEQIVTGIADLTSMEPEGKKPESKPGESDNTPEKPSG